jgi:hypothetical protein
MLPMGSVGIVIRDTVTGLPPAVKRQGVELARTDVENPP